MEDPTAYALLVTDIHMPGSLDGIGIARLLRARRPDFPVIYATGRPDALNVLQPLGPREVLLCKPFALSALLTAVQRRRTGGGQAWPTLAPRDERRKRWPLTSTRGRDRGGRQQRTWDGDVPRPAMIGRSWPMFRDPVRRFQPTMAALGHVLRATDPQSSAPAHNGETEEREACRPANETISAACRFTG